MKAAQMFIFLGLLLASGLISTSDAAAGHRARVVTRSAGCGWWHTCCPARYLCSSLYGGYGPYGGALFWSQYTYGGWAYVR